MTQSFHCPNCGAPLDYHGGSDPTIRCAFCQTSVIVPAEMRRSAASADALSPAETLASIPDLAAGMREIVRLARAGNKIQAIQLFQKQFKTPLKEARDAVEQIERGEMVTLYNIAVESPPAVTLAAGQEMDDILRLLQAGQRQEAERLYRELFDLGAAEASAAVEAIQKGISILNAGAPSMGGGSSWSVEQRSAIKTAAAVSGGIGCAAVAGIALTLVFVIVMILFGLAQPGGPLEETWLRINPFAANQVTLSFGGQGSGAGLFEDPRTVAVDGQGFIYVGDFRSGRIQRFDAEGNFDRLWNVGERTIFGALAADRSGRLFAVYDGDIHIFEGASGRLMGRLPRPDVFFDRYDDVSVTADGGLLAIAGGDTLVRINPNLEIEWVIEDSVSGISGDSELSAHTASDGLGNIYVLGDFNSAVFKFGPDGRYNSRWGSAGEERGQLRAPRAIAVDGRGRVYVSDFNGIQVFENDGRFVRRISVPGAAFGLAFGPQGELFVVTNTPRVLRYSVD